MANNDFEKIFDIFSGRNNSTSERSNNGNDDDSNGSLNVDFDMSKLKKYKKWLIIPGIIIVISIICYIAANIYINFIELNEIGYFSSVYVKNLLVQSVIFAVAGLLIFFFLYFTVILVRKNIKHFYDYHNLKYHKGLAVIPALLFALIGASSTQGDMYIKYLEFFNSTSFNKSDPVLGQDIGYYIFQRPFLMSILDFFSGLIVFALIFAAAYYIILMFMELKDDFKLNMLKPLNPEMRGILIHLLSYLSLYFLVQTFTYKFIQEGILYSEIPDINIAGASYTDVNIWMKYYQIIPFVLIGIVIISIIFLVKKHVKGTIITVLVYPATWILVALIAVFVQQFFVKPNMIKYQTPYIKYNMEQTRAAYNLDSATDIDINATNEASPTIINDNIDTVSNMRVVDYKATEQSNKLLQSIKNFYSVNNGDIINYTINGKQIPVLISAREIDKSKLPDATNTYTNKTFKYTHGYGIVMNPINRFSSEGQAEVYVSGLNMDSVDPDFKIAQPRIYYGEMTNDEVVVGAQGLNEIDYDGFTENRYDGAGGIQMNLFNKLIYSFKNQDFNMLISGYVGNDSKLLVNPNIMTRVNKAFPLITFDSDPYIIPAADGTLEWVVDGYTSTDQYPYSQSTDASGTNYIRNSVKAVVNAYNGKVKLYAIDKNDPIIATYQKIYPDVFSKEELPTEVKNYSRYPESLFKIQTSLMNKYHMNPDDPAAGDQNIMNFINNSDLWAIAQYPYDYNSTSAVNLDTTPTDIDPYYVMLKLPQGASTKEELILMRPYTPYQKNNMVSWLAVKNSYDEYGKLVLYDFPININILGPNQVAGAINQIDELSKDITLWNSSGSKSFKGNLLVIPIEQSILYVEPIYIQATNNSSAPQVKKIVVGYQKGQEFKYGYGVNLNDALSQLFPGSGIDVLSTTIPAISITSSGVPSTTPYSPVPSSTLVPNTTLAPTPAPTLTSDQIASIKAQISKLQDDINALNQSVNSIK